MCFVNDSPLNIVCHKVQDKCMRRYNELETWNDANGADACGEGSRLAVLDTIQKRRDVSNS